MYNCFSQDALLAWQTFTSHPLHENIPSFQDETVIRQIIYDSWIRSYNYDVFPASNLDTKISDIEYRHRLEINKELIEIATPYLHSIFDNLSGTNYLLQLCDKNACVLKHYADTSDMSRLARAISVRKEGYVVSEETIGTSSTGICQHTHLPVRVVGAEHYQQRNHAFACSSAPIFNHSNTFIGILTIMQQVENYQPHTLGVVCAAADGICKELTLRHYYDKILHTNNLLSATIETLDTGIILLDSSDTIIMHNKTALEILNIEKPDAVGINIFSIIKKETIPKELKELKKEMSRTSFSLSNHNGDRIDVFMQINVVKSEHYKSDTTRVLSFNTQSHIFSISNDLKGFHASYTFDSIIGDSEALRRIKVLGRKAATTSSPVLIYGESGTGKELLAQSIHNASERTSGPFVSINCGAIPKNLIASELFGTEYGAFTGAKKSGTPGKFELANGGTLFLDEVGDMPIDLQVSLLRVLQNHEIIRLGGETSKSIDVRIISATNKNLVDKVIQGTFRQDLYYRLNVLDIYMPPLRERRRDILELANFFLKSYASAFKKNISGFTSDAEQKLINYIWPGNVRELENTIERAANINISGTINADELIIDRQLLYSLYKNSFSLPSEQSYDIPSLGDGSNIYPMNQTISSPSHLSINSEISIPSPEPDSTAAYSQPTSKIAAPVMPGLKSPEQSEYEMIRSALIQACGHTKTVADYIGMPISTFYAKLKKYNLNPKDFKKW